MQKETTTLEQSIQCIYDDFLQNHQLDKKGIIEIKGINYRFSTMPYIGEEYTQAKVRILFIGLDMGMDETAYTQDFECRRNAVSGTCLKDLNLHISGTYIHALYFLQDHYGWTDQYEQIRQSKKECKIALRDIPGLPQDVLQKIALTNTYKFAKEGQENRTGTAGRKPYLYFEYLLIKEINALKPDIIIFQGGHPKTSLLNALYHEAKKIFIGRHPSWWVGGNRIPEIYINNLLKNQWLK